MARSAANARRSTEPPTMHRGYEEPKRESCPMPRCAHVITASSGLPEKSVTPYSMGSNAGQLLNSGAKGRRNVHRSRGCGSTMGSSAILVFTLARSFGARPSANSGFESDAQASTFGLSIAQSQVPSGWRRATSAVAVRPLGVLNCVDVRARSPWRTTGWGLPVNCGRVASSFS